MRKTLVYHSFDFVEGHLLGRRRQFLVEMLPEGISKSLVGEGIRLAELVDAMLVDDGKDIVNGYIGIGHG